MQEPAPRLAAPHNTLDQLKSAVAVAKGIKNRYNKGIGVDDFAAFNKIMVEWTEVQMKNAIVAREACLAENRDNKMLLDFPSRSSSLGRRRPSRRSKSPS